MAEQENKKGNQQLGTILKFIFGFVLCILGVFLLVYWWENVWNLIKGCLGAFVLLVGLIFIAIAKE